MSSREYNQKYYQEHKEAIKAQNKDYKRKHKELYSDYQKTYVKDHNDELKTYHQEWLKNNQNKLNGYAKKYHQTKNGRAHRLRIDYQTLDKKKNLVSTLTSEWIYNNILSGQVCVYCGENDWQKLGCDRLDNTRAHTPDNCVPCCKKCNCKKRTTYYGRYMLLNTPQFLKISK